MSPYRTPDIRKALGQKGFRETQSRHTIMHFLVGRKKTGVRTILSHGRKEYGDSLLAQMAKQLRISRSELNNLLDCPLTEDAYRQLLIERGAITRGRE